jgi:hypothetical protein
MSDIISIRLTFTKGNDIISLRLTFTKGNVRHYLLIDKEVQVLA